jgi:hypothetical protein
MPFQNRIDPFGESTASAARGAFMGNRGGRIHRDDRALGARRWASRQWICCRLDFKGRQRSVFGAGYTELFFLDEVTALAAGHRPCFECRREDANVFAANWERATGSRLRAPEMDLVLHAERLEGRRKRTHRLPLDALPDGAMIALDGHAFALRGSKLLRWTPEGYSQAPCPHTDDAEVLTPPSILAVLGAGYRPHWHQSAD